MQALPRRGLSRSRVGGQRSRIRRDQRVIPQHPLDARRHLETKTRTHEVEVEITRDPCARSRRRTAPGAAPARAFPFLKPHPHVKLGQKAAQTKSFGCTRTQPTRASRRLLVRASAGCHTSARRRARPTSTAQEICPVWGSTIPSGCPNYLAGVARAAVRDYHI